MFYFICTKMLKYSKFIILLFLISYNYSLSQDNSCKKRLSETVNNYQPVITPVISVDSKYLFVDRKLHPNNTNGINDLDDIWLFYNNNDTIWSVPTNKFDNINTIKSDVVFSLTPDNKALIYGNYNTSPKSDGFSISQFYNNSFSKPIQLKIKNYYNNSENYFAYLSPDTRILLLALNRKDSYGGMDLYVSFRLNDNYEYSEPKSLGAKINTNSFEGAPFLAYDNKTLFFSSNRASGYGKKDLYCTKRLDDSWENWSEPQNLGSSINTPFDESAIYLTPLGDSAYINSWDTVSKREGIYKVCIEEKFQPEKYLIVYGQICEVKSNHYSLINDRVNISVANDKNSNIDNFSSLDSGYFYIVIPPKTFCPVIISKEGFSDFGFSISSRNIPRTKFVQYNANLKEQKDNYQKICTVYFDKDSDELSNQAIVEIQTKTNLYVNKSVLKVLIVGHTDETGTDTYNFELSKRRAEKTKEVMIREGFKSEFIKIDSKGKTEQISKNDNENRRVEIFLISE